MSEEGIEHSPRGPSAAHRWRRCPGSINAERGLPDKVGREAAVGTVFHEYAAMCLQFGLEPEDFPLGVKHQQDGYEVEFDQKMVDSMREGLDWIRDQLEPGDLIFVEQRVDISPWTGDDDFGTSDVTIIKRAKRKIIQFDWKYGAGVPVSPVENDQMFLYTLGAWNSYAKDYFETPDGIEVLFRIEQPRAPGGGGEWRTTMKRCLKEGENIKIDAEATRDPDAPRIPGEKQCHFCKASGRCGPQAEYLLGVYGQKFADIDAGIENDLPPAFDDPGELTTERRSYIVLHWAAFKRFVDRVHALTLHDLKSGVDVPLLKAVTGRAPHRKYKVDHEAEAAAVLEAKLGEKAYEPRKLISPAQAEGALGKKVYAEQLKAFVEQGEGKPILVPLSDKRPPIQNFAERFDDLDDPEDED